MELERLAANWGIYREISELSRFTADVSSKKQLAELNKARGTSLSSDSQKIFKHISDYYAGEGNLSKSTAGDIKDKDQTNYSYLTQANVNSANLYASYKTSISSYGLGVRYVRGVSSALKFSAEISRIYKTA